MPEELDLNLPGRVLLNPYPEEGAEVIEQTHAASAAALEEGQPNVNQHKVPAEEDRRNGETVHCRDRRLAMNYST